MNVNANVYVNLNKVSYPVTMHISNVQAAADPGGANPAMAPIYFNNGLLLCSDKERIFFSIYVAVLLLKSNVSVM